MAKAKKKPKKKTVLSKEQKLQRKTQRDHIKSVRSIFTNAGFHRVSAAANQELEFEGTKSDIDDVFIFENVVVIAEYTTATQNISEHLKKKKVLYDKIVAKSEEFIQSFDHACPEFASARGSFYQLSQYRLVVVYCSLHKVENSLKREVDCVKYLDFQYVKYFQAIAGTIRRSVRFELFDFLSLEQSDIGPGAVAPGAGSGAYEGSILPEAHSSFGKGFKIVSFYVDPDALLSRCYVLRKDRWEDKGNLYQRMISKKKIEAMRRYLLDQKRVFVNNIIITLPSKTKLLDMEGNTKSLSSVTKTAPARIQLPTEHNSIGLIDGQHRVFSYYEGGSQEAQIKVLRHQQNLLATGIIYPSSFPDLEQTKFEAKLFLEINATQTNAKSDLKQAIGLLIRPFSPESIAKEVVNYMNDHNGPLFDLFERYFFDKNRLKTTSVVSYAVKPIVKLQGPDTLFKEWKHSKKDSLANEEDKGLLAEYVEFCAKNLNLFLAAARASVPSEKWTADKTIKGRLLTTTTINGLVICFRKQIESDKVRSFDYYKSKMDGLKDFQFGRYKSSQYTRMGQDLFEKMFA